MVERESIVCLRGIWKTYAVGDQEVHALAGVDLDIRRGEYVAIMGPSGSGKSTMLNLLGCLDRPTDGTYHLGEEEVSGMNDGELSDLRNRRIGFVFQSFNLIPWLTLEQNIEVPLFYGGMSHGRRRPISEELAHRVGLGNRLGHRPNELSGGQKQRVAIARSLANDPLVLLADEPTGNLDSGTTREILDLFDELHQRGRTIIMVTHEEDVAKRTQRILRMRDGVVVDDSPTPASQPCEA